jgi:sugar lactone lactonase YvrE
MIRVSLIITLLLLAATSRTWSDGTDRLVWPAPPDTARLEYVGSVHCAELSTRQGLFGRLKRLVGGKTDDDQITLPFDVLVRGEKMFMTCQNIPALIEVSRTKNDFKLHIDKKNPLSYPVCLCDGGSGIIYLTDSENGFVYRFSDGKLKLFIASGLVRPTGIAALPELQKIYVVDTGEHLLKIFDYEGNLLRVVPGPGMESLQLHYPTFATATADGHILINDALNYRIKRFDADGNLVSEFGVEGDGPGAFSRPKGISVDGDAHVYVMDNLFDNLQVFDAAGNVLLAVGSAGQEPGQFWSPAGIDIHRDTVYIADTFNNRIQVLRYLGGRR